MCNIFLLQSPISWQNIFFTKVLPMEFSMCFSENHEYEPLSLLQYFLHVPIHNATDTVQRQKSQLLWLTKGDFPSLLNSVIYSITRDI